MIINNFTKEEKELLDCAGGYYIYNCKKMRKDEMENRFIEFAKENCKRIVQPEQDVINLCCCNKKKRLHPKALVCSYSYIDFKEDDDYKKDEYYSADVVKEALEQPIQLHYATPDKPWLVSCPKQEVWFYYLSQTGVFFYDYINDIMPRSRKKIFSFKAFNREFLLTKKRIR